LFSSRGDQRDRAREKNQKKQADNKKGNTEGLSAAQRKERDAAIMKQKQDAAAAAKKPG
jgi:hypothetical protein